MFVYNLEGLFTGKKALIGTAASISGLLDCMELSLSQPKNPYNISLRLA